MDFVPLIIKRKTEPSNYDELLLKLLPERFQFQKKTYTTDYCIFVILYRC